MRPGRRAGLTGGGSRHQPEIQPERPPSFSLVTKKAQAATEAEAAENPRSRSAKLRAAIRNEHEAWPREDEGFAGVPPYRRLEECVQ